MTQSRRMVTATLLAAVALGGTTLVSTAAMAGEGGGGQHTAQRAKLKAEWAEARARKSGSPDASFVERLFGLDDKETTVAAPPTRPKKN